ncbi:HAD family phosphatase [Vibrio sp. SCSIO 43140]|uniref:HAD family hydrolase n=1 Tax=Vibrio sp. SCSIO 43140 TaxID=2819100 RepID=UPI00207638F8|nr:HAD family phosphatase [Vibrio sp. SCSIO 43140]USD59617.1 HAD family phosphatase [Vibrio sp. SCSIO 43140]
MKSESIKNVVFDVGNVIVRWSPIEIVNLTFGTQGDESKELATRIFQSETWLDINKGLLTEQQAKAQYQATLGLSAAECDRLFYYVKETQILLFGTLDLINALKQAGYRIFALTDNVNEIVAHLKQRYDFWPLFEHATISSELGFLKPSNDIYQSLLTHNDLIAEETVFLDDMPYNVEGAKKSGMHAIQFADAEQASGALRELGLTF